MSFDPDHGKLRPWRNFIGTTFRTTGTGAAQVLALLQNPTGSGVIVVPEVITIGPSNTNTNTWNVGKVTGVIAGGTAVTPTKHRTADPVAAAAILLSAMSGDASGSTPITVGGVVPAVAARFAVTVYPGIASSNLPSKLIEAGECPALEAGESLAVWISDALTGNGVVRFWWREFDG